MRAKLLLALALLGSSSVVVHPARAEDRSAAAAAEKLFGDGRALMAAGRYSEACPKLAESQRLDPGVGTLLNLGECYEHLGLAASAWATYLEAAGGAHRDGREERAKFAEMRAAGVLDKVSYLTVRVRASPPGLKLTRNGEQLGAPTWGTPIPVDPGPSVIEATAPGRVTFRTSVDVGHAARTEVEVPALAPLPEPPPPATADVAPHAGGPLRAVGWAGIATGGALLAAGTVVGLIAISQNSDAHDQHCTAVDCDATGVSMIDRARGLATASTILFVAGGVAAAAGIVVVLTAPSSSPHASRARSATTPTAAHLSLGIAGLSYGGAF